MSAKVLTPESAKAALKVELIVGQKGSHAVHDVVVAMRANRRAGTACAKQRGEVAGTGSKPWRQKGTGRARSGQVRSPLWRKGGVVFGPRPRDYSKTTTKAIRRLALRKALSERIGAGEVAVVESMALESHKTKGFLGWLKQNDVDGSVLIVDTGRDPKMILASRNVPGTRLKTADEVNTEDVLRYDRILVTAAALERIGERLRAERK
ncbi:MAG TPA: 50S ribosomal protein L4 [Verrucomicrobiae bacterium]|nr:50S ribosomal protein L4 [Verrucomicrobiae bacterium]